MVIDEAEKSCKTHHVGAKCSVFSCQFNSASSCLHRSATWLLSNTFHSTEHGYPQVINELLLFIRRSFVGGIMVIEEAESRRIDLSAGKHNKLVP
jgi:hypothetical protein